MCLLNSYYPRYLNQSCWNNRFKQLPAGLIVKEMAFAFGVFSLSPRFSRLGLGQPSWAPFTVYSEMNDWFISVLLTNESDKLIAIPGRGLEALSENSLPEL